MSPLDEAAQRELLRQARQAVKDAVCQGRLPEVPAPPGPLSEPCGAFVTLHTGSRLRGCIGYVEAHKPLLTTVRECAMAAALRDPRFEPVTPGEVAALRLEISVLSPLEDVAPEQIEIGRHGLVVSRGFQRGLLLPQVAVEWKWDRERFLSETCQKAGMPPDAWRYGARIQAFTAQVFEEPASRSCSASPAA